MVKHAPVGGLLREWRQRRRMSQLDLFDPCISSTTGQWQSPIKKSFPSALQRS
jgi:hypothetical protein